MKFRSLLFIAFVLTGCAGHDEKIKEKHFPRPGTVVAIDSMPVKEETLNHFIFTVSVVADSSVNKGIYDVDADFGPNFAEGQFTLPAGAEDAAPAIKKGAAPYTYIIGFKLKGDTTFYDYFEVASTRQTTKMRYIKSYTF